MKMLVFTFTKYKTDTTQQPNGFNPPPLLPLTMGFPNNLYLEGREESFAVLKSSIDVEGEHPRMAKLLRLRQLVLGVAGKAWTPQNLVAFFFYKNQVGHLTESTWGCCSRN